MARRDHRPEAPRLPEVGPDPSGIVLQGGAELAGARISGDFADSSCRGMIVEESLIVGASLARADLGAVRMIDVVVEGADLSGVDLDGASLTRVEFRDCRLSGAEFPQAHLSDVVFSECKLDRVNFRMSRTDRVVFSHSILGWAEFSASHLVDTRFFDCDLTGSDWASSTVAGTRFLGSTLDDLTGAQSLRGAVVDSGQLLPLALRVFADLGIRVDDERDTGE